MPRSNATTAEEYLQELPDDRRAVVATVRETILRHLPAGYRESVSWGMLSYEIPLERYPDTYNGQPLGYVALGAQKSHYSLYLMGPYMDPEGAARLEGEFRREEKRLDMGKACLRFRKLADLPLEVVGRTIARTPPEELIRLYEESRRT